MNDERPDRGGELRSPPLDDQVPSEEGGADHLPGAGERSSDAPADQLDLDNLLARLQDAERQREQVLDDLRRVAADFDNYRKRVAREQTQILARSGERVVAKLLPVLDDLERALDAAEHHEEARVLEGVRMAERFRPEFLNRIDEIVVFESLTREQLSEIVTMQLARLNERLAERGLSLELTDGARELIAEAGWDSAYGARPLKRAIQRLLENPLALRLLEGEFSDGDTIRAYSELGEIRFTREEAAAPPVEEPVGAER